MNTGLPSQREVGAFELPGHDQVPSARRPVLDIEGVGDHYAKRLRDLGVHTIGDLAKADLRSVAQQLDVSEAILQNWRSMGELIDVWGIGPQFAELLVRCKIRSVRELAESDPQELLARILLTSSERMVRIQGAPVGSRHVSNWIEAARRYLAGQ
jgi:nucleotidyltransferase/DNA polymerase involved in DNA repair